MIKFFRNWRRRRRQEAQLKICRYEGHWLIKNGFTQDGKIIDGSPFGVGPETAWILTCKCGYGEVTPVGTAPYRRSYLEGEKMKQAQGVGDAKTK